jgi:Lysine/ornithine N-monooxygenase
MRNDIVGVGVGPSNLSLAALLAPHTHIDGLFFEAKPAFEWHSGLMLPGALVQTPYVKDLVTLIDPTSKYSFLSFLAEHNRLYQFIIAGFTQVSRQEFNQYYQWVADSISSVKFNKKIRSISFEDDHFVVHTDSNAYQTRNVVLGTGQETYVPKCALPHIGGDVFHSSEYLNKRASTGGKRILVAGGGQSGAEIVHHLLSRLDQPDSIVWLSRRYNFLPLEDGSFTSELYTPGYSDYFFKLPEEKRLELLERQRFASDGISAKLIESIYQRSYDLAHLHQRNMLDVRPGRELLALQKSPRGWSIDVRHSDTGLCESIDADVIVLATGYASVRPNYLDDMVDRLDWGPDGANVTENFSVVWDGPSQCNIFLQNGARNFRGIADPNLSLMPWRSATIANAISGTRLFNVEEGQGIVNWGCVQSVK